MRLTEFYKHCRVGGMHYPHKVAIKHHSNGEVVVTTANTGNIGVTKDYGNTTIRCHMVGADMSQSVNIALKNIISMESI